MVIRDIKEIIWSPGIKMKKCGFQGYKGKNVVTMDKRQNLRNIEEVYLITIYFEKEIQCSVYIERKYFLKDID